jgi:ATP-binding cassette subfamily F protein 3
MVAQEAPGGEQSLIGHVLAADHERAALLAEAEAADTDAAPERIAEVHQRLADIEAHTAPSRAAAILAGLGFDEAAQGRPLASFSGGWRMRVALAAVLFSAPDLLLLDEPTNYLDLEGTLWLEGYLRRYPHAVLLVSHDRDLLNRAVGAILHVDRGKLTLYRGGYDDFEALRRERQAQQEKLRDRQEAQRKHMQAYVDRFRYKASKARQAQSRLKAIARLAPIAEAAADPTIGFQFPAPGELRSPIISLDGAAVGYGDDPAVLSGLDLRLDADDRVALLGRNGNGKTTLARLLAGRLSARTGEVRRGSKLRVGYFAQHQIEDLRPEATAIDHLAPLLPALSPAEVRGRLGAFGLVQDKAGVAVAQLSGGERARLVLALISAGAPNLLILDEPTNHLDVDARQALVQALNDFAGAVLLISHDRHLVELTAERLWLVADGGVRVWDGDLEDYRRAALRPDDGINGGAPPRPDQAAAAGGPTKTEARRAKARARERQAPLRRAVREAEQRLAGLESQRQKVARALADPGLYTEGGDRLADLNRRQADLDDVIAKAEAAWLAAAERLETAKTADN